MFRQLQLESEAPTMNALTIAPNMHPKFRVWAEVDCDALRHNHRLIRSLLPQGTAVMAVLKASGYGHGGIMAARVLSADGVEAIGVGDSQEAIEMRRHGIDAPILILGAVIPGEMADVIRNRIQVNIHSLEMAKEVNRVAASLGVVAEVQLLIDSGMGRLGAQPNEAPELLDSFPNLPHVKLVGICTHFSSPGETDPAFTRLQIARFNEVVTQARRRGHHSLHIHAASHTALLRHPEASYNMVRPGLALWGITAAPGHSVNSRLSRVLSLKTQVIHLKTVRKGTPIGYSRLWHAPEETRIATLPIGYNDGFPIALTGKSEVLVRGRRCPVVGRVSMDYIMVDVGAVPNASLGDVVTVIGKDGSEEIRVEDLASAIGTIPYEITCRLGRRVKRVYTNERSNPMLSSRYGVVIAGPGLMAAQEAAAA